MSEQWFDVGVAKDASDTDLKKAYRQLSLKYHPDRCPGEEGENMMRKVNEAYETLSDNAARQKYDFELEHPGAGNGMPSEMDMFFQHIFSGSGNPFMHMFGSAGGGIEIVHGPGGATFIRQRQPPTVIQVAITLEQAFTGITMPVSKPSTKPLKTPDDAGEIEIINIPAGINNGQTLIISPNFHVCVNVQPHALFTRNGNDLLIKRTLSLKEALCGAQVSFTHLNGKHLTLNISNAIVSPGSRKSFLGMGFTPIGNLIVEFDVAFPTSLTQEQRDAINNLL